MIVRTVFAKLKPDHATAAARAELVAESRRVLPNLPGVVDVEIGAPADDAAMSAWDLFLRVRFERLADVGPYLVHPDHRAFVDDFLAPRVAAKKAWNFETA